MSLLRYFIIANFIIVISLKAETLLLQHPDLFQSQEKAVKVHQNHMNSVVILVEEQKYHPFPHPKS